VWRAADEHRHPVGPGASWYEAFGFDFSNADASFGGYVRLTLVPDQHHAWYWAAVVGADRSLVTIAEVEAPLPSGPRSLEVRTEGLWADHNVEEPFERWSLGLEAFALRFDDPVEALTGAYGHVIPVGLDMEWERSGEVCTSVVGDPRGAGYTVASVVHGELLVDVDEVIEFEGVGRRQHHWGVSPWGGDPWVVASLTFDDGTEVDAPVAAPNLALPVGPGTTIAVGSTTVEVISAVSAPVAVADVHGVRSHLRRSLVRVRSTTGLGGVGWIDENKRHAPAA
jgi:hypothetical protein